MGRSRVFRTSLLVGAVLCGLVVLYALAGFVLLPYAVERFASRHASEQLGLQLSFGDTDVNPFLLRVEAAGVRLAPLRAAQETAPQPKLEAERVVVDLAWSSFWRPGWSLSELALHGARASVVIGADGRIDWTRLVRRRTAQPAGPPPQLRFEHIVVRGGRLVVLDRSGGEGDALLTAIELDAHDLATHAPQDTAPGRYRLRATVAAGGGMSAHGTLALAPVLQSRGGWALADVKLPAVWPVLRAALDVEFGPVAATLDGSSTYAYEEAASAAGAPAFELQALSLRLGQVAWPPGAGAAAVLRLASLSADGGRLDLPRREVAFPQIALRDGAVRIGIDAQGQLDLPTPLMHASEPTAAHEPRSSATRGAEPGKRVGGWHARVDALRIDGVALHGADHSRSPPLALDIAAIGGRTGLTLEAGAAASPVIRLRGLQARLGDVRLSVAGNGNPEPLLDLDVIEVTGGTLDSAARRIEIEHIASQGGRLAFDLADRTAPRSGTSDGAGAGTSAGASGPAWDYAIGTVSAEGMAVDLRHSGFEPPIVYRAEVRSAMLDNMASAVDAPMRIGMNVGLDGGGTLQAEGTIAQGGTSAALDVQFEHLPLLPLQPLLAQRARAELRSGSLSAQARLTMNRAEDSGLTLRATGSAGLHTVRLDAAGSDDRLLSWQRLQAFGADFDSAKGLLRIARIELQEPGARLVIAADNSVNLGQVLRADAGSAKAAAPARGPPMAVAVERIDLRGGVVDFADLGLVLPFATRITQVHGSVVNIDTRRRERARVQASGEIEPFGSARVEGSLLPFAPRRYLDLDVVMKNVAMPPFSPYTATFAGRKVAEGRLWLDLDYHIENGQLLGRNDLRLSDFRLGERVAAPGAMDLPLDLAVALLTDSAGTIRLSVPVRGDIGKPRVDVGSLLRAAFANTLRRVVAAPFRAIAGLFGSGAGDGRELAQIEFAAGSDALLPPQREKLDVVGRAIAQRPQLRIVVVGPYASGADAEQLRRRAARRELAQMLGESAAPGKEPGLIAYAGEPTRHALQAMFVRYAGGQMSAPGCPSPAAGPSPEATGAVAEDRPYEALFECIAQAYPLPAAALPLLASRRAEAIRAYLVEHGAPEERVRTGRLQAVKVAGEGGVYAALAVEPAAAAQPLARAAETAQGARRD